MRTTLSAALFVLVAAGAAALGANIRGSDTMEDLVKFMLSPTGSPFCPGTTGIIFMGGGSTTGEQAMTGTGTAPLDTPSQSIAPMSRLLVNRVCQTEQGSPATAASNLVCIDALVIVGNGNKLPGCELRSTPGTQDWRDVLRMVYAGFGPWPSNAQPNCARPERRALVDNWAALFNPGCTAGDGTSCPALHHAYRRTDYAGSTDTFLALLGLPSAASNPFCNGIGWSGSPSIANSTDFMDNDPIRRRCVGRGDQPGSEQVCNWPNATGADQNSLGLVQVIHVPELHAGLPAASLYTTRDCTPGFFAWRDQPAPVPLCPYGLPPQTGACLLPYAETATGPDFACLNRATNRGFYLETNGGDGRVYNLIARRSDAVILRDVHQRRLLGSFYRVHSTRTLAGGVAPCREERGARQVGCLVTASPCSIGYATREAMAIPGTTGVAVRGKAPTVANIQEIAPSPSTGYPLARPLYLSSVVNPDIVNGSTVGPLAFRQAQQALKDCFMNPGTAATACEAAGFVSPAGGPTCIDFDEQALCGAATNVDACAP